MYHFGLSSLDTSNLIISFTQIIVVSRIIIAMNMFIRKGLNIGETTDLGGKGT